MPLGQLVNRILRLHRRRPSVSDEADPPSPDVPHSTPGPQRIAQATLPSPDERGARTVHRILRHVGVIAIFSLPAIAIFWHAWDGHLASTATCACSDAGQQIWFIAWPAYALSHWLNPFFTSVLWAPGGTNLLLNTSGPLIGLALAPVTWLWGPVASTNIALTLAPALSSWASWVACRRLVTWRPAAWVAGPLFGYSPFVISNLRQGHLTLGVLVIPPLMLVVVHELLSRPQGPVWRAGVALGLLAVVQFLISPEVLTMACVVALIGVFVAGLLAIGSSFWRHTRRALQGFGIAVVVAGALLAFPAWFALAGPRHLVGPTWPGLNLFGINLNDLWDPDPLGRLGVPFGHGAAQLGLTGPNPAFLGTGVLVVVVLSVLAARRRKSAWVLLAVAAGSGVLSLGSAVLRRDALSSFSWLPWQTLVNWPVINDVLPGRFALFTDLAVSVVIAIGLDAAWGALAARRGVTEGPAGARRPLGRRRGGPWVRRIGGAVGLGAVAASVFVPIWTLNPIPAATEAVTLPPWFTVVAPNVPSGSVVLTYPFPASASLASAPMVWQADDDMHFDLAGGYVKVPGFQGHPLQRGAPGTAVNSLIALTVSRQTPTRSLVPTAADLVHLRSALTRWDVSYVVVTTTGPSPVYDAAVMTATTGRLPHRSNRAWVWNLHRTPLTRRFNAVAAASAFGACRSTIRPYQDVRAHHPIPQGVNRCVSNGLGA